jgi:hypothetical protein
VFERRSLCSVTVKDSLNNCSRSVAKKIECIHGDWKKLGKQVSKMKLEQEKVRMFMTQKLEIGVRNSIPRDQAWQIL